tara:strand:+ start:446 stop:715 length:270 start_codon:yes stop_codon:yes gene_type:complete
MGYEKHNGWTNYATWRVNLEIIDGIDWYECEHVDADYVKELVEDIVFSQHEESLMSDYANAFLSEVNYHEIAENIINESINEKEEAQGK